MGILDVIAEETNADFYVESESVVKAREEMTPAEEVKSRGVKSLRFISEKTGVSLQTLGNWYKNKRALFDTVVAGVKAEITEENEKEKLSEMREYYRENFRNGNSDQSFLQWIENTLGLDICYE
jgi:transposase